MITVSGPDRDPRGYSISTVFMALVRPGECRLKAGDRVSDVAWYPIDQDKVSVPLAFDHEELLRIATRRLRAKAEYSLLPALLLPPLFTVPELERLYHHLIGAPCPNYTLRRRLATGPWLKNAGKTKLVGKNRLGCTSLTLPNSAPFSTPCDGNHLNAVTSRRECLSEHGRLDLGVRIHLFDTSAKRRDLWINHRAEYDFARSHWLTAASRISA